MAKEELHLKIEELLSHLSSDKKYQKQLLFCIAGGYWDLATLLVWKCLTLFLYEKISQIEAKTIIKKWDRRFNKNSDKTLKNEVNLTNLYWPNEVGDDKTVTFIGDLYPVDQNLIKQARLLKSDRDMCAHVSEIETTKNEFISFLDKTIRVMNTLQTKHQKFLKSYIERSNKTLSSKDRNYVITIQIKGLVQAHTFASVEKFEKDLENNIGYFNKESLKDLLTGAFNSPHDQFLGASYTSIFLEKLFDKTKNFTDLWDNFSKKLKEKDEFKNYYKQLTDKIEEEWIPF